MGLIEWMGVVCCGERPPNSIGYKINIGVFIILIHSSIVMKNETMAQLHVGTLVVQRELPQYEIIII